MKHAPTGHPLRNIAKFDVVVQEDCFPDELEEAMEPKVRICYFMLDFNISYFFV